MKMNSTRQTIYFRLLGFYEHKEDKYAAHGKYYLNGLIYIILF